jgi:hypothetical protein
MGPFVMAKIDANPNIAGTATLVEYVGQGQGWQLVEPIGIYPL